MTAPSSKTKLIVLVLPGADWRLAQPLVDEGALPTLEALIDRGTIGNLAAAPPLRWPSPLVSLATGTLASTHGVAGPFHPAQNEDGQGFIEPFSFAGSNAAPLWDVLASQGYSAAHIGFPGVFGSGAETSVSDLYAHAKGKTFEDWPLDETAISDDLPEEVLTQLRLHPLEVTPQMLLPFLADAQRLDLETDQRAGLIATLLARLSTLHGAATWILEQRQPDCLMVHLDYLQHLSSLFLGFAAPKLPQVTDTDHAIYGRVVEGAYRFLDMLLERYAALAGEDCHILLASTHGMRLGDMRPPPRPDGKLRAAEGYRPLATLLAAGPSVKADALITGAHVQDIAPTALALLGAAVPESMDGRVLTDLFNDPPEPETTSEPISRSGGKADPALAGHLASEWTQLGLTVKLPEDAELAHEYVVVDNALSLSRLYMARITKEANALAKEQFETILSVMPDHQEALLRLSQIALRKGDLDGCRSHLNALSDSGAGSAMQEILNAQLALASKDKEAAEKHLGTAKLLADKMHRPIRLYDQIGRNWLGLKRGEEAEAVFKTALTMDPDDPLILGGHGMALLLQGHNEDAVAQFRGALAVLHEQPDVHSALGRALGRLGRLDEAVQAYGTALKLNPNHKLAQKGLAAVTKAMAQKADAPA